MADSKAIAPTQGNECYHDGETHARSQGGSPGAETPFSK